MSYFERRLGLKDRIAIIGGGGGGLGRACAIELGRAGMRLALADRNKKLLQETVSILEKEGVEVFSTVIDVRDEALLGAFFDDVDKVFGNRLDVLVNVVGGTYAQPFAETKAKGWQAIIRTNFTWLLHSIQLAIPRMKAGASIINFTSIEAHRAVPNNAVYGGIKAAINNFGRSLAVELGPRKIRVNAIAPDMTPTEGYAELDPTQSWDDEEKYLQNAVAIPMGREGTYSDIGGSVLFLASDLSEYVTGQTLFPDGGAYASSGWFNWPDEGWRNKPPRRVVETYTEENC